MRVDVVSINFDNVVKQIMYERSFKGRGVEYCIMNQDTFDFLMARNSDLVGGSFSKQGTKLLNLNIAICPNLQFGEVDIK